VLARLIRATAAAGDTETSEALQRELPPAPQTSGLDVGALEDSSRAVGGGARRPEPLARKREATEAGDDAPAKVGSAPGGWAGGKGRPPPGGPLGARAVCRWPLALHSGAVQPAGACCC
jgi:hypothetical protein